MATFRAEKIQNNQYVVISSHSTMTEARDVTGATSILTDFHGRWMRLFKPPKRDLPAPGLSRDKDAHPYDLETWEYRGPL